MPTKLTANVKAGGCAAKLSPSILDRALRTVPRVADSRILVGYDHADDAGVYDLTAEAGKPLALVQTVDFFTPIVDDPYTFGAIAAANALSDVYAMGGKPISALSMVVFPAKGEIEDLTAILRGGADKIHEAGCVVLGGHSISDDQIKFGYAVTGLIDPSKVWTNANAAPGDVLLFTKKLGAGVISSALKQGIAEQEHIDASIAQMLTLNRDIAEVLSRYVVHACTDITGFGLLGHAREMALASQVTLRINATAVRLLGGALDYSRQGAHSAGLRDNKAFVESCVEVKGDLPQELEALLYDPQTSGGLLVSLPRGDAEKVMAQRSEAYLIGEVLEYQRKPLEVVA